MYSCASVTFIYKQMSKVFDTVINMAREKLFQRQCSKVLFSSSGNVKARTELQTVFVYSAVTRCADSLLFFFCACVSLPHALALCSSESSCPHTVVTQTKGHTKS